MSLALTLMPVDFEFKNSWESGSLIDIDEDTPFNRYLGERLKDYIHQVPVPVSCFKAIDPNGEYMYGEVTETPYGSVLEYIRADDLLRVSPPDHHYKTKAAWSYLTALDADHKIVLYWS